MSANIFSILEHKFSSYFFDTWSRCSNLKSLPAFYDHYRKFVSISYSLLKYNQTTLNKLEKILDEAGYIFRYERGSFQSGFCILEDKKVVVLNKFLIPEGRINTLMEIIPSLVINYDALTHDSQKLYDEVIAKTETPEKQVQ
jgi:hypothetical protein